MLLPLEHAQVSSLSESSFRRFLQKIKRTVSKTRKYSRENTAKL